MDLKFNEAQRASLNLSRTGSPTTNLVIDLKIKEAFLILSLTSKKDVGAQINRL